MNHLHEPRNWTDSLVRHQQVNKDKVFDNKVLRKIFGAMKDEINGECRKLHNAELHTLYSSPKIIWNLKARRLTWARHARFFLIVFPYS